MELNNDFSQKLWPFCLSVCETHSRSGREPDGRLSARSLLLIQSAMSWKGMFIVRRPASKDDMGMKQQLNSIEIKKREKNIQQATPT